jgi:hypothetical protein
MKIVIDIPEEVKQTFDNAKTGDLYGNYYDYNSLIGKAIRNGTPLPKEHGRLIDADEFEELFGKMCPGDCGACDPKRKTNGRGRWYDTCSLIDIAPTIIEADTAESEEV